MKTTAGFYRNLAVFFVIINFARAQFHEYGVSCKDRKLIVDRHNYMRLLVARGHLYGQPKASNMLQMVWDDNLAYLAQNYAFHMTFAHNPNRKDYRFQVGENLYMRSTTAHHTGSDWNEAMNAWLGEHTLYSFRPQIDDHNTGHYTQGVWASTMFVGCGYSYYWKNGWFNKMYVCNYGPTGNYLGQYPYAVGNGCENLCCTTQCSSPLYGRNCIN